MNFQGARYYRNNFSGTAPDLKVLLRCRNRKLKVKNGLRSCEGSVRFKAKIVNDQIETCTDQLVDYKPHCEWCEFVATNAKLERLTSTRKTSPRPSQKLSVKALKPTTSESDDPEDRNADRAKPQPRKFGSRQRDDHRSKVREGRRSRRRDDLSDESDDGSVSSADRSDPISKEDSMAESSDRLLVRLNKLSALLQELIDHPPDEEAKRKLNTKFGECGTKFEELSKSFVKTVNFLGARYRIGGDDSLVFGKDILTLACKNRHPSRGAENRCDAFLIFENNGETPNAIFRMNKFVMYSRHSASCEYFSSNSDLDEFFKSSKNLWQTGSDGRRPSEGNRTEQDAASNFRSAATVRSTSDRQPHQTRPSTSGSTIDRKRKPEHADDRPPVKRRDSKWSGDTEGSTFRTTFSNPIRRH